MIVLAGPNGAGKSTLYATRVAPGFAGPFINADIIQRNELRDPSPEASYEAARIASSRRAAIVDGCGLDSRRRWRGTSRMSCCCGTRISRMKASCTTSAAAAADSRQRFTR